MIIALSYDRTTRNGKHVYEDHQGETVSIDQSVMPKPPEAIWIVNMDWLADHVSQEEIPRPPNA